MSYLQQELQVIEQTRSQVSDPGDQLDEQEAKTRKRIALMHAVAGQLPDAAEHFTRAAALQPDSAELHALLGKALMELGRRDEADQVLRHALALDARSAQAHAALGWLLMTKPDDDQAMQHLRTALQIDPGLVPPHDHLANILAKHGKFAQAAEHYRAALAEPSPQIHYKLAKVLTMTGGLDEALNHFRHALRTRPDWVAAMNGAAWILATHPSDKQRDAKQALRIAKEAATMTHYEDAPLLNTLAAAYAAAGEFKRAVATARAAIAIAEQDDDTAVAEQIRHYLQWYERGEPYRQEPAAGRDNSAQ